VCIKLAPTRREKPAAIEKNAVAEEMSRMVAGGLRTQYRTGRGSQGITRVAGPKEKAPAKAPRIVLPFSLTKSDGGIKYIYPFANRHICYLRIAYTLLMQTLAKPWPLLAM
jgi:hypothetical protein